MADESDDNNNDNNNDNSNAAYLKVATHQLELV